MRLRNQEVEAIAIIIENKRREDDRKERSTISKGRMIQRQADAYLKLLNQIPIEIRTDVFGGVIKREDIIDAIINQTNPPARNGYNDIKAKVVAAAMESKNLEELKIKLNIQKLY